MQFQIEVLSVIGPNKVTKGKNSWEAIEVAYKRDGKVEGKKLVDFNGKEVFAAVQTFKQGEVYNVEATKDDNGYWQWTSVTRGSKEEADASVPQTSGTPDSTDRQRAAGGRVMGSNYETPEERKIKQRFIVRQSALNQAITLLTHNAQKASVHEDAVMQIADKFVAYVYESRVQDMDNDIPV